MWRILVRDLARMSSCGIRTMPRRVIEFGWHCHGPDNTQTLGLRHGA